MHRVADNYNWKTLKHWRIAVEAGNVRIKVMENDEVSDALLRNALRLLENDCFPLAMICCKEKHGQKELFLTSLWKGIFDFLEDKRSLEIDGETVFFTKMADDKQKSVLSAQVPSIWIESD